MTNHDAAEPAGFDRAESMRVERETLDSAVVVHVHGDIDITTADALEAKLESAIAATAAGTAVVIDLTGVEFLGSAGLAALLAARDQAAAARIPLRIVAGTRVVLRPLEITGVAGRLDIRTSLTDALRDPTST